MALFLSLIVALVATETNRAKRNQEGEADCEIKADSVLRCNRLEPHKLKPNLLVLDAAQSTHEQPNTETDT